MLIWCIVDFDCLFGWCGCILVEFVLLVWLDLLGLWMLFGVILLFRLLVGCFLS